MVAYSEDKMENAIANFNMITTSEAKIRKIVSASIGSLVVAVRLFYPGVITFAPFSILICMSVGGYRTGSLNQ